ncbi:aldo/keto reductase [bacterium]|nr:aldo/keto reductase [bacterium]
MGLLSGFASPSATASYRARFTDAAPGHFRACLGVTIGSVGMGTYLGNPDGETDDAYSDAVVAAVSAGCNVIDSAANYRFQRSERSIGAGLRRLAERGYQREEILLCTKGGYIPFDGDVPNDPRSYFTETFIQPGIATPRDLVGGMHCMTPKYLAHQLDASCRNLGVETIDVYYIHNPESQLEAIDPEEFYRRIRAAFEFLEGAVSAGKIRLYGCATWDAFRVPPESPGHVSLSRLVSCARDIAGAAHHFRVIQLPLNLLMPEALSVASQEVDGSVVSALDAAEHFGMAVFTSVPILQGRLARGLPAEMKPRLSNLSTDAQCAIQFVRSAPAVASPLVGMSRADHVTENLSLRKVSPLSPEDFAALFS